MARLKFELTYYDGTVQYIIHYTTSKYFTLLETIYYFKTLKL